MPESTARPPSAALSPSREQDAHTVDHGLRVGQAVAGVLSFGAALHAACAVQLFVWTRQRPEIVTAELLFLGSAALLGFVAPRVARASAPFTVAGMVLGGSGALFALGWFAWMQARGAFSFVPLLAVPVDGLGALACLAMVPISRRVAAARDRIGG